MFWTGYTMGMEKKRVLVPFILELCTHYKNKKEFIDTLGHEMVHLFQMTRGDSGNHNKLFYSYKIK